jgi:D-beta-D-heptose 7-phosphate kinase/D-beta-D-heptose 1-phosphate adenosyltransferase
MIKVLVIGEICTDRFIYGEIERLSPEAPVPVLKPIEIIENSGMTGNVIKNLLSIDNELQITHWHQSEVIIKTRYVEKKSNHMFIRIDDGELTNCKEIQCIDEDTIKNSDIVIVSDYNKGFLSLDNIKHIGELSKISILDSKKILSDDVVSKYKFVKLNKNEYFSNSHLTSKNIIITMGADGAMFKNKIYKSNSPAETIDVSGAGDTFVAAFIIGYYKTINIEKSIEYANRMASIVVNKRGVATPI